MNNIMDYKFKDREIQESIKMINRDIVRINPKSIRNQKMIVDKSKYLIIVYNIEY